MNPNLAASAARAAATAAAVRAVEHEREVAHAAHLDRAAPRAAMQRRERDALSLGNAERAVQLARVSHGVLHPAVAAAVGGSVGARISAAGVAARGHLCRWQARGAKKKVGHRVTSLTTIRSPQCRHRKGPM